MTKPGRCRTKLAAWIAALVAALLIGGGAVAQTGKPSGNPAITLPQIATPVEPNLADEAAPPSLDYAAWDVLAGRAEAANAARATPQAVLESLRAQLVDWRAALLVAQSTNSTRIATLRAQIAALGPTPAEGETEAAEIAGRRTELSDQLVRLQAPGIAADEAYRRADGLIREIDRVLRERQAEELLRLWPAPVNPTNWPVAMRALTDTAQAIWTETATRWSRPGGRDDLGDNLPLILAALVFAALVLWRGRPLVERLTDRLQDHASARGRQVWALLASLGQILVPAFGLAALAFALALTGLFGVVGQVAIEGLADLGLLVFAAVWLGGRLFPKGETATPVLTLTPERRAVGRVLTALLGLAAGVDALRVALLNQMVAPEAAVAVLSFPVLVVAAVLLVRLAHLLRRHVGAEAKGDEGQSYRNRLIGLLARLIVAVGYVAPVLAAVGYISAGAALVYPAAHSLALLGLLVIVQRLVGDVYVLVASRAAGKPDAGDAPGHDGLVPVLIGFGLMLLTLPAFALIWGARLADLTEIWTRFREGFQLGDTRIAPTDFLVFASLFAAGYALTKLLQGALKSTILPKTSLDTGGQNAILAGVGYIGVFLAALIAINTAGIDLSGLAIVAGALSVGIGFGLQNIVSNFVSGIILLIERPISEGDWIEVGPVQGIVKAISVRSTRIQTFDRTDVIVPNTDLVAGRVTNWTRYNLTGRLIVPVSVPFTTDTRLVERLLREITEAQPMALLNPPPLVVLMGFGAETINFEIRVILRDVNFSLSVRSEINHQIARRFAENGIQFSSAHRDFLLRTAAEAEALRLEAQELSDAIASVRASLALPQGQTELSPSTALSTPGPT